MSARSRFFYAHLPTVLFCLLVAVTLILVPEDVRFPAFLRDTIVTNAEWSRLGGHGDEAKIFSKRIRHLADGSVVMTDLSAEFTQPNGVVALDSEKCEIPAKSSVLHFQGDIEGLWKNNQTGDLITLRMEAARYDMDRLVVDGERVEAIVEGGRFRADSLLLDERGDLRLTGNVWAEFVSGGIVGREKYH